MKTGPKPKTIRDCQQYLARLYGDKNKNRSSDYLYGYLSRTAAYLGKNVFQRKVEDVHFIRTLSWLLALANYFEIDAQDSVFSRFPEICPYCLTSPCMCLRTNKQPVEYIPAYKAKEELFAKYAVFERSTHDWSFGAAITVLTKIYPNNEVIWHHAGPWYLFAKMQEEIGELHEAISKYIIRQKPKDAVAEEIADTLAWLLSAWGIVSRGRSLDDAFINYYYNHCPVCTRFPCACADRADRPAELIDPRLLEKVRQSLSELEQIVPASRVALQELHKSIAAAADKQSEPTTVHALKETRTILDEIKTGVSAADEIGKRALSIIETVTKLLDKLPWSGS